MSFVCLALVGCATRTATIGSEFDSSKISSIKKGATTGDELVELLGQPFSKSVHSKDGVIWVYSWVKATSRIRPGWISPNVSTEGHKKKLEVLIENGVVVNYVFIEGPFHSDSKEGSQ